MIKSYLVTLLTIFILGEANAQLFRSAFVPYWIMYNDETNGQSPKAFAFDFKEVTVKSGKKTERYIYNYDKLGRLVSYVEEKAKNKNNNKGFIVRYAPSEKKLQQRMFEFKNNIAYQSDSSVFNKFNALTAHFTYDKNNQLTHRDSYFYDSTLLKEQIAYLYKKGVEKISGRIVYEYESGFQLKKITYYDKKGKTYRKTVFDCNPIGVNRKISKDSLYRCVKYEVDSLGNKMQITIENVKNKSTKVVSYYNSENKLIAQKNFDVKKDRPNSFVFFNEQTGAIKKFIYFDKGKEVYRSETTFNEKNNVVEIVTYSKNKPTSFLKNEFNKAGLVTVSRGYNNRNKLARTVNYSYALKE